MRLTIISNEQQASSYLNKMLPSPEQTIEKLEELIKIQAGIIEFKKRIVTAQNNKRNYSVFYDLHKIYTHRIEIYDMCITRLHQRYNRMMSEMINK